MREEEAMKTRPDTSKKIVFFATGNFHKFNEARIILKKYGWASAMLDVKTVEIQSDSLAEIAKSSALTAFKACNLPLIVEDAGLFVDELNGFPGPYAAYVYKTVGNSGLLKLMNKVKNRKAIFQSAIAYYDGIGEPTCFEGEARGEIVNVERWGRSKAGFGFDPIFKPVGKRITFAEMEIEEKNACSHRAVAVRKFVEWYGNVVG